MNLTKISEFRKYFSFIDKAIIRENYGDLRRLKTWKTAYADRYALLWEDVKSMFQAKSKIKNILRSFEKWAKGMTQKII
ncbi:hypothetical protein [Okeania sp. KiyG1]|uniref:hypothetical protein n=1 Tax=Okeania sp. KiyG1 TaxID=2720165 RepID=UPI00192083E1|nr:hypothetical protein [Okeania sp. KiyG1]